MWVSCPLSDYIYSQMVDLICVIVLFSFFLYFFHEIG